MPLEDYCANLKNYFIADFDKDIHVGVYTIKNGVIGIDNFSRRILLFYKLWRLSDKLCWEGF